MPSVVETVFVFLLVVVTSIFEYVYFWPRFRADVAAGKPGTRTRAYQKGIAGQWFFALGALVIWSRSARSWTALGFTTPHGWRFAVALVIVIAALALLGLQLWSVLRLSIERRIAARPQLGGVAFMLPRTRRDEAWFVALSVTAGFCEELLYRGYLPWFFSPWLGTTGALAAVVVLFGAGHIYQGRKGAIRATLAGAVMAGVFLVTGSLIPGMIAHALIDIGGGTIGYLILRDDDTVSERSRAERSAPPLESAAAR